MGITQFVNNHILFAIINIFVSFFEVECQYKKHHNDMEIQWERENLNFISFHFSLNLILFEKFGFIC